MSILQLFPPDKFYKKVNIRSFVPGQICWIPTPVLEQIPKILDVKRSAPEEHASVNFKIRQANEPKDFRKKDRSLPLKYLNLKSHEELLIYRGKRRPAIILSSDMDCYDDINRLLLPKGKKHLQEDCLFMLPCYSIDTTGTQPGFIPEMLARIQCFKYKQFFYVCPCSELSEGVVRFDRIQIVIGRAPAAIQPTEYALSDDIFNILLASFLFCISGKIDGDLEALKDILSDSLPG